MKTKLTLTIDKELVPRFKKYARRKGISVSKLVENSLRELTIDDSKPFTVKWKGKFKARKRTEPRYKKLEKRYLK